MDEGTSALDSQTEARVQQAITEEQKLHGMTVILIAHRLSTVRYAHKIVVLSNGKKLEEGSHDDLLSYNGAYARMIRLHHGVVPGDDTEFQPSTTAPSSTYNPTPADLKAAVSTNYNSAPPTSTHPAGLPTAINNNELTGIRSRPGPGTHEYSMTITNAEEAKASVEAAEKETSEATKKARWRRFFAYVLEQKWWIFSGGIASILM
jgi:ABC-type glutathione transport system ATPase component